ncbi:AraC family transcriptional regulator [Paenibacillus sp. M1]|uniref:AraC family transcriptional regulator n=1 Tax=Paenibacillus haidiansis TaxID=1574488 RepID=A0ABU7VQV3_9BACL
MPVLTLTELLPVYFLTCGTGLQPNSVKSRFVLIWSSPSGHTGERGRSEITLIPPGLREFPPASAFPAHADWFSFHSAFLENHDLIKALDAPFTASSCAYTEDILARLSELGRQVHTQRRQIDLSNALFSLVSEILEQIAATKPAASPLSPGRPISKDGKSIILATRYIREHMDNPDLSLYDIANVIGYNSNYFCYKFSCIMQISPIRYLKTVRLEQSLRLLKESNHSIQAICRLVGIRNPSSLSSLVKSSTGLTPIEFRMRYRQQKVTG